MKLLLFIALFLLLLVVRGLLRSSKVIKNSLWVYLGNKGEIWCYRGRSQNKGEWITREELEAKIEEIKEKPNARIFYSTEEQDGELSGAALELYNVIASYNLPMLRIKQYPPQLKLELEPFTKAIGAGNTEQLIYFLESGTDPNRKLRNGVFPLIYGVHRNQCKSVEILLAHGVDPNSTHTDPNYEYFNTPVLSFAAACGYNDIVLLLLGKGALIENKDQQGNTALVYAAYRKHIDCVKTLLAHGANPNVIIRFSKNEFGRQGIPILFVAAYSKDREIYDALLEAGVDINARDESGLSFLMFVAFAGNTPLLEELIQKGIDIEYKNSDGNTALLIAAFHGQTDCVKALLNHGANVHDADIDNSTAIMLAAQFGYTEIVAILLQHGADPRGKNKLNISAIDIARRNGKLDALELMENWK